MTLVSLILRYWVYLELVYRAKQELRAENPDADMSTFKVTNFEMSPPAHRWYPRTIAVDLALGTLLYFIL